MTIVRVDYSGTLTKISPQLVSSVMSLGEDFFGSYLYDDSIGASSSGTTYAVFPAITEFQVCMNQVTGLTTSPTVPPSAITLENFDSSGNENALHTDAWIASMQENPSDPSIESNGYSSQRVDVRLFDPFGTAHIDLTLPSVVPLFSEFSSRTMKLTMVNSNGNVKTAEGVLTMHSSTTVP